MLYVYLFVSARWLQSKIFSAHKCHYHSKNAGQLVKYTTIQFYKPECTTEHACLSVMKRISHLKEITNSHTLIYAIQLH